jgi:hypothetical protein
LSGIALVNLIETSSKEVGKAIANQTGSSRNNPKRNAHKAALEAVQQEAEELRKTLLLVSE